jgi:hypothetical protein
LMRRKGTRSGPTAAVDPDRPLSPSFLVGDLWIR